MAKFTLNLSVLDQNDVTDNYKQGIESIIQKFSERVRSRDSNPIMGELIKEVTDPSLFVHDRIDIERHPKMWTQTNRVNKSTIIVDNASNESSTYESIHDLFKNYLKKLSRFNTKDKADRIAINKALDELEQWQTDAVSAYVQRLRDRTADALIEALPKCSENQNTLQSLINQIESITQLTTNDLRTSTACLKRNKQVNTLRNDLLKFNQSIANLNLDIPHLAEQLSVVSKRWIDPFYAKPRELTKTEKARRIAKMILINLAEILAVTAFILFFVFPPASFPVGVAASIGMFPIFDGLFEVARNLWYGRSPTVEQAREVGIGIFLVVGLTFCAYGVTVIGMSIMKNASNMGERLVSFGTFMATKAMRIIDVFLNTIGSIFDAFQFTHLMRLKTEEQIINRHKPIAFKKLMTFFYDRETNLEQKRIILEASEKFSSTPQVKQRKEKNQTKETNVYYVYRALNKDIKTYPIKIAQSQMAKISHWITINPSLFKTDHKLDEIKQAIKNYFTLPIHATAEQRIISLANITNKIAEWKSQPVLLVDHIPYVGKLERKINKEQAELEDLDNGSEAPYLVRFSKC